MRTERKTQTFNAKRTIPISQKPVNGSLCVRNLRKNQLGGVIFGCTRSTMKECLSKQLFGLPARHFSYVKNIDPGLPLFLFNYTDRKLHGIFEASSMGKMYIDPYAWINDDYSNETQYPAQVKVRVGLQCRPLTEDKFRQAIAGNYYDDNHFRFELDRSQTNKLMFLLTSAAIAPGTPVPRYNMNWRSACPSLTSCKTSLKKDHLAQPVRTHTVKKKKVNEGEKNRIHKKLLELTLGKKNQDLSFLDSVNGASNESKIKGYIEEHSCLEKNEENVSASFKNLYTIVQSVQRGEELKAFQKTYSQMTGYQEQKLASMEIQLVKDHGTTMFECTNIEKTVIRSFQPENAIKYFPPMSSISLYTSQVQLRVGGYTNGFECFTNTEMLNLDYGKWINVHSNLDKRFDLASMELNSSFHSNGGYNEFDYSKYTLDGSDECTTVPYMELFDPCLEARIELMNHLGDFSDTTYFKESMEPGESKFLKSF